MLNGIKDKVQLLQSLFYKYSKERYPNSFLTEYTSAIPDGSISKKIPRIIYVFWTGDNELTKNRRIALASIEESARVNIQLITKNNLHLFIKPDDPLPSCFQFLSAVHKADYLRTYFMYHYGGGYTDIKIHNNSWVPIFKRLENSNAYVCGYRELGGYAVAHPENEKIYNDLNLNWWRLLGNCAYICKPHTKFTEEWYRETQRRVMEKSGELEIHPATDPYGKNDDYPIPWTYILGDVFHPLCLKYYKRLIFDDRLKPSFVNYR